MDDRFVPPQEDNPYRSFTDPEELPGGIPPASPESSGPDPLRTIWSSPRETIRRIVETDPDLHVTLLICLAGISESLDRASTRNAGDDMSLKTILILACILGPLGGLFSVWIFSHLIRFTGIWLNGHGAHDEIQSAMAWASVPNVAGLALWIALLSLLGEEMFTKKTPFLDTHPTSAWIVLAISLAQLILGIWSLVLLCNTVAEVQGYQSAWRGLGNLFLAGAAVMIPILLVVLGFSFLLAA